MAEWNRPAIPTPVGVSEVQRLRMVLATAVVIQTGAVPALDVAEAVPLVALAKVAAVRVVQAAVAAELS
jgi:hypothetical protein